MTTAADVRQQAIEARKALLGDHGYYTEDFMAGWNFGWDDAVAAGVIRETDNTGNDELQAAIKVNIDKLHRWSFGKSWEFSTQTARELCDQVTDWFTDFNSGRIVARSSGVADTPVQKIEQPGVVVQKSLAQLLNLHDHPEVNDEWQARIQEIAEAEARAWASSNVHRIGQFEGFVAGFATAKREGVADTVKEEN